MKIKNDKQVIKKNEFRKNKGTLHPAYIYAKVGNEYKFIGLTHSKITDGVKNIKLEKNPNPKDGRTAYMKPVVESGKTNKFSKKKKGWNLSVQDKKKANRIIKK